MIDKYTLLVNKENKVPENIENIFELIQTNDTENEPVLIEKETFDAFIKLKNFILEKENILIGIDGGYRSVKRQEDLYYEFVKKYGKEYADSLVAPAFCSEHHTGLAIDVGIYFENEGYIIVNDNFDKVNIVFKNHIHKYLNLFGFILRYPENKEKITGYPYEPWHIRYVGKEIANNIYTNNLTLEEYLN